LWRRNKENVVQYTTTKERRMRVHKPNDKKGESGGEELSRNLKQKLSRTQEQGMKECFNVDARQNPTIRAIEGGIRIEL
jgi:hypothetical protein